MAIWPRLKKRPQNANSKRKSGKIALFLKSHLPESDVNSKVASR
jgi:hypothetical protein